MPLTAPPNAGNRDGARTLSLADQAYLELRERIATGRIVAGQRLTERSLAMSLGISATPVREALRRLEQEALIVKAGPRTIVVAEHSARTLAELQYAEVALRGALARFAAAKATPEQIAELRANLRALEREAAGGVPRRILEAARGFDYTVSAIADNPAVTRLAQSCEVVARAARLQAIEEMVHHRRDLGEQHLRAHAELCEAIAAHDGERAETVILQLLRSSLQLRLASSEDFK